MAERGESERIDDASAAEVGTGGGGGGGKSGYFNAKNENVC